MAKKIAELARQLPAGVKVDVMFNQADYIMRSVKSTADTLWIGALLAVLILFVFFGGFRSTIYVAVAIPISIFFAIFLMYLSKMTINIISLGGLTIAIGMVVDCAIVVFEAIFRHREKGASLEKAASDGTAEVAAAITSSTLTTIAVFLPLLLVTGFASVFFGQLALTVTFALVSSLVVALTIIPMLAGRLGGYEVTSKSSSLGSRLDKFYKGVEKNYSEIVRWALSHRKIIVFVTSGVFVVSLCLIPFIGTELTPEMDHGEISLSAEMPVGTKLAVTDSAIAKLEQVLLREVPEMKTLSVGIGSGSGMTSLFTGSTRTQCCDHRPVSCLPGTAPALDLTNPARSPAQDNQYPRSPGKVYHP